MKLPPSFLDRPIAHRGLHDTSAGRAENSLKAFEAAIEAGYGIELDLQPSKDGVAMVFHDYFMNRLTAKRGPIALRSAESLGRTELLHDGDTIPTLEEVLDLVAGRVPLLIEFKDQDGSMGKRVGSLEKAAAEALADYDGDVAVMSFNPHSVAKCREFMPDTPRGLVTAVFDSKGWPLILPKRRKELRAIPDYERVGACFISHEAEDLDNPRIQELRADGATILCWTIKSAEQEAKARRVVDNVTFEGYLA